MGKTVVTALTLVLAVLIGYFVSTRNMDSKIYVFDPRNATYEIEGKEILLINGEAQIETTPGSASKTIVRYFGNEVEGDLNGDGLKDKAFLITQDGGGSGLFYYAVVALKIVDGYKITNSFFIGDRIAPQSTYIPLNSMELQVNYAERKLGEPMTSEPSVGAVKLLKVTSEGVLEGLMK
jgi:hypothetical protein